MNSEKTGREINSIGFFDLAKGLGMIFIVMGHSATQVFGRKPDVHGLFAGAGAVLGAAVVAMYFMVSGYGFFKKKPKKCFLQQVKLLLKPYAVTGLFVVLAKLVLAVIKRRSFLKNGAVFIATFLLGAFENVGENVFGIPVESVGILWFILALFEVWIAYNYIVRIKDERLQHIVVAGIVVTGYVIGTLPFNWPFMLPQSMIALGYFHIGFMLKKHKIFEHEIKPIILILTGSSASFCLLLGYVSIAHGIWKLGLIDVAGTFSLGFLLMYGYVLWMGRLKDNKLTDLISAIGFSSIWVVCIHGFELCVMPWHAVAARLGGRTFVAFAAVFALRSVFIWIGFIVVMFVREKLRPKKKKVVLE